MNAQAPHVLIYAEAASLGDGRSRWRFVVQPVGGDDRLTATDIEAEPRSNRVELLAVVRGLEALDQPSRVTLITGSRYVSRGLRREINQWRERRWRWERFGKLVPINDHDLWQRVDRALEFHQVECCAWQSEESLAPANSEFAAQKPASRLDERRDTAPLLPWSISATLSRLRQRVLTPFSAIRRPAFTRAA